MPHVPFEEFESFRGPVVPLVLLDDRRFNVLYSTVIDKGEGNCARVVYKIPQTTDKITHLIAQDCLEREILVSQILNRSGRSPHLQGLVSPLLLNRHQARVLQIEHLLPPNKDKIQSVVTDWIPGHPWKRWLWANPTLRQRIAFLAQICQATHHLHTKGVIHGDLGLNVLVDQKNGDLPNITIHDYGSAILMATEAFTFSRSGEYSPPEVIHRHPNEYNGLPCDRTIDIFALGVMTKEILGLLPELESNHALKKVIARATDEWPDGRFQSVLGFFDALKTALEPDKHLFR